MNICNLVSVIVPTYNRVAYLSACIDSVLAQSYNNYELIIVDDSSTDNTRELVEVYISKDKRVRYVLNSHKRGPAGARNQGILVARGMYIAFLDSDDLWNPEKLKIQIDYLSKNQEIKVIGSDCLLKWGDKDIILSSIFENIELSREHIFETILKRNYFWIYTPTVILRKEIFQEVGLFDEDMLRCEDLDLWLRINERFKWGYIQQTLAIIYGKGAKDKYDSHHSDRIAPTGYYRMLLLEKLPQKIHLSEKQKAFLSKIKKNPNHYFWLGYQWKKKNKMKALYCYGMAIYYNYRCKIVTLSRHSLGNQ